MAGKDRGKKKSRPTSLIPKPDSCVPDVPATMKSDIIPDAPDMCELEQKKQKAEIAHIEMETAKFEAEKWRAGQKWWETPKTAITSMVVVALFLTWVLYATVK